jgi:hypothetical protein
MRRPRIRESGTSCWSRVDAGHGRLLRSVWPQARMPAEEQPLTVGQGCPEFPTRHPTQTLQAHSKLQAKAMVRVFRLSLGLHLTRRGRQRSGLRSLFCQSADRDPQLLCCSPHGYAALAVLTTLPTSSKLRCYNCTLLPERSTLQVTTHTTTFTDWRGNDDIPKTSTTTNCASSLQRTFIKPLSCGSAAKRTASSPFALSSSDFEVPSNHEPHVFPSAHNLSTSRRPTRHKMKRPER